MNNNTLSYLANQVKQQRGMIRDPRTGKLVPRTIKKRTAQRPGMGTGPQDGTGPLGTNTQQQPFRGQYRR